MVEGDVEYLDNLKNETKIVKSNGYNIKRRFNKREFASNNRYIVNKLIKLIIIIEKEISEFVINTLL